MKNLYRNRFKYFFPIHIISLIIIGVVSTVYVYQKYVYGKQKKDWIYKFQQFESNSKAIRIYHRYTGTETAFGFFAPNVKSQGTMFFESCRKTLDLPFETNEGNIRVNCMISNVTDYIDDEIKNKEKEPTLKHRFSDLLIQNLVAKVRQVNSLENECKEVKVTYSLLEFPPLKVNIKSRKPLLIKMKTWIYETK